MKLTYNAGKSLISQLREAGVNSRDAGRAAAKIRALNGLGPSEAIPDGTVLRFPDELKLGRRTVHFDRLLGNIPSLARDGDAPSGGRPMGVMGIFAFDGLRNGNTATGCRVSAGCGVIPPRRT
jgi:hypothetical protein